jgi:hypothetical protein
MVLGTWCAGADSSPKADKSIVRSKVLELADVVAKNGADAAAQQADQLAKSLALEDVMDLMKLRKQKGLGIGPAATGKADDGIEAKIINLSKHAPKPKETAAEASNWEQAAYVAAAIAILAQRQCPVTRKQGKKDPKNWNSWCADMEKESLDLATAVKAQKPKDIQHAAAKLNSTCNACHADFREE